MAVASARYGLLVSQLHHLSHQPQILPLTDLLAVIFKQPTKWLPENVGSVLLLLGQVATKQFLMQAVIASAEEVAHAFTGLALMTARFRRPFTAVFHRLDEIVEGVEEGEERDAVLSAIWRSLTQVSFSLFRYSSTLCGKRFLSPFVHTVLIFQNICITGSERAPGGPTCRGRLGRGGRDAHL